MPPPLSSADPTGLLGRTLDGRYPVVAFVGEGDLGYVYRSEQTALRRACALKVLHREVQRDRTRLARVMEGSQRVALGRFDAIVPGDDILTTANRTAIAAPPLPPIDPTVVSPAPAPPTAQPQRLYDQLCTLDPLATARHSAR